MARTIILTINPYRPDDARLFENARDWIEARRRIECDVWENEIRSDTLMVEFRFQDEIDAEDFHAEFYTRCGRWNVRR